MKPETDRELLETLLSWLDDGNTTLTDIHAALQDHLDSSDEDSDRHSLLILRDIGGLVNKWYAKASTFAMMRSVEMSQRAANYRELASELQALNSRWKTTLDCWFEVKKSCRIHEHDGAFKCYTHQRMWGAVTNPDEPCEGWKDETDDH